METGKLILPQKKLRWLMEFPLWVLGISFAIGTLLLVLFIIGGGRYSPIMFWGFLYVVIAFGFNLSVLIAYALLGYVLNEYQQQLMQRAALLLVNIPVAILYFYIVNTWKINIY